MNCDQRDECCEQGEYQMSADSQMLNDHVQQARESLEAAQTSVKAARDRFTRLGDAASAEFLREAEVAQDDAQAEYNRALGAQDGSS